jgi:hypothetical protein
VFERGHARLKLLDGALLLLNGVDEKIGERAGIDALIVVSSASFGWSFAVVVTIIFRVTSSDDDATRQDHALSLARRSKSSK